MLFDQEVKTCKVCKIPTLVDHGCEYDDGFICKWCDKNDWYDCYEGDNE